MNDSLEITQYLGEARRGDSEAMNVVFEGVYDTLRSIAHKQLNRNRSQATMSTTALVHEAYERLVGNTRIEWQDRVHFFAVASRAMRFILVDYARARSAQKRGGAGRHQSLDAMDLSTEERAAELVALDEALELLFKENERLGKLVEMKFFGGMTYEEIAETSALSVRTVKRDWQRARTWLYFAMKSSDDPDRVAP